MSEEIGVALSALQHYLYCPRQCGLIHVEQLWEESRHTAEGRLLHERADKPRIEHRKGVRTVMAMPLASAELGISGIADVVEFHQGPQGEQVYPVEYKRGAPKAHRADEVQLCAQALCLEGMLGQSVPSGALYYGQTRRRTEVQFDALLRQLTLDAIAAVRAMVIAGKTPGAQYSPRRCDRCSLVDVCQPKLLSKAQGVNEWVIAQCWQIRDAGGV
ncbi:CRISPR-associated protein Cas4 [Bordetella avium]|uniref:CRISPR-associated protein Cas4 n=1 Tax=Bordetella avium TaxID=521 RepID=UPI000E67A38E|nr:CRISPR-associated protein Cas4 [Bordetella avium]RIQ18700.1 CRISPR-associated protein Cas4 [Bordetella avium]RIQ35264.1 CRISPR-associated protein Cas4 [Bordetella avium]